MKPATTLAAVLFLLFAFVHALRLAFRWEVTVRVTNVPMWVSAVAIVVCLLVAFGLIREARSK